MKKKLFLGALALVAISLSVVGMSAFEAHVINVTATIENSLTVPVKELDFGQVFPQERLEQTFEMGLSTSFMEVADSTSGNMIVNGSFENPEVTSNQKWDIFPNGTTGLGWTVEWESSQTTYGDASRPAPALQELHEEVSGWLAQEGNQYAELDSDWDGPTGLLNGEPALVKIYQDVPTVVGRKYLLTYNFSPRPGTDLLDNTLNVRINSSNVASHNGVGGSNTVWTEYSYEFVATYATTRVEFAGGGSANSLGVFLDNIVLTEKGRLNRVSYMIRQKPKCVNKAGEHPQVGEDLEGNFVCPDGSEMMPLLCPYLSKHEITTDGTLDNNDSRGISAFHGLPGVWNMNTTINTEVYGALDYLAGDIQDEWNIDLKVPCFEGSCAQDWPEFVWEVTGDRNVNPDHYKADPATRDEIYGCDLWVEVTGFDAKDEWCVDADNDRCLVGGEV